MKSSKTSKFRLQGGGCKAKFAALEEKLLSFYRQTCLSKLVVSRTQLQQKARDLCDRMLGDGTYKAGETFNAFNAWLDRFMDRNGLSLRRATKHCQKPPSDYVPKIVEFVSKKGIPLSAIYACDETDIGWMLHLLVSCMKLEPGMSQSAPLVTTRFALLSSYVLRLMASR